MTPLKQSATAALIGLSMMTTPVSANPSDVTRVTEGLIAVGMAFELSEECDSVGARKIRGLNFLWGLKSHLKDLGYSNAQIDAYIDNRAEKDRLEAIARQRLHDLGVRTDDPSSYCSVARGQIAQGTLAGSFLR